MGDDPDRAAILGRRNRLIALALSGIGAAAGCGDPVPCLAPMPREPAVVDEQQNGPMVPEEPVLEAPVPVPEATPVPCLGPTLPEGPDEPATEPGRDLRPDPHSPPYPYPCLTPPYDRLDRETRRKT